MSESAHRGSGPRSEPQPSDRIDDPDRDPIALLSVEHLTTGFDIGGGSSPP